MQIMGEINMTGTQTTMIMTDVHADLSPQESRLYTYLMHNKSITPLESWQKLGIYRLSDKVFTMKKKGHNIVTDIVEVSNSHGEVCRVGRYRLEVV